MTSPPPTCCCAEWIGRLAHDHAAALAAVARHEGLAPADALDAVQDAFHTLIGRSDKDALRDRPDDAARLLAAMVRNAARNHRRRHFRSQPHVDAEDVGLADPAPAPDAKLATAATATQLSGCMAKLGDVHRHVVTLRILEELSGAEAARELGLTAGHVAVLLHRARQQLADCMAASG
jgi:RNA polymerase sigma factor (sigma-70 family)